MGTTLGDYVRSFQEKATEEFSFLQTVYGMELVSQSDSEIGFYPDAEISVKYLGHGVGVQVYWYLSGGIVNVALVEAKEGQFPAKVFYAGNGHPVGIDLYRLVQVLYPQATREFMIPPGNETSLRYARKRGKIIESDMRGVLQNLATMLRRFADNVLKGDTSQFEMIRSAAQQDL